MSIANLVTLVAQDKPKEVKDLLHQELSERVVTVLDAAKHEIAEKLFVPSNSDDLQEGKKYWMAKAFSKHKGSLHKALHVPQGEKIPAEKLEAAAHKKGKIGKKARLAKIAKSFHEENEHLKELKMPKFGIAGKLFGSTPRSVASNVHSMGHKELKSLNKHYQAHPADGPIQQQQHRSIQKELKRRGKASFEKSEFVKKEE